MPFFRETVAKDVEGVSRASKAQAKKIKFWAVGGPKKKHLNELHPKLTFAKKDFPLALIGRENRFRGDSPPLNRDFSNRVEGGK